MMTTLPIPMTAVNRVLLALAAIVFCAAAEAAESGAKIKIVASIAPLADFARQVGGDRVDVVLLLPPGASPHTYEPTPRTMQSVSKAKIFLKIGAGLEFWADRLIRAAGRNTSVVDASEGMDLIRPSSHAHGAMSGLDPHYWLDPVMALQVVTKIEKALSSSDPPNAAFYAKNSAAYRERLKALDREIAEKTAAFRIREYVTFHSAWNYFSRRYGLRVAGVIEEGPGREPSPKHIEKILAELKRSTAKVVFAEPQFSPKVAEAIAREAGGKVLFLDPVGGQEGRETYIDMIKYNLRVMEGVMK